MKHGKIIIITGAPGTGKTTTVSILANQSCSPKTAHMHTDDFYHYLCKGAVPPYLPESQEQNLIVAEAFGEAAKRFARGGYDVFVDGIIGPWFLSHWLKAAQDGYEVHYIILRASAEETMARAVGRTKLDQKTNRELVTIMWGQFQNLGDYEENAIDTTGCSIAETVSMIEESIQKKTHLLSGSSL